MRITKYITMAGLALSLASCDSWLDDKPKGFTIPELTNDYQMLMQSQSLQSLLDPYLNLFTDDPMMLEENTTTVDWFDYLNLGSFERNIFSFANGHVFNPGESDPIWEAAYSNIFTYNCVINNVLTSNGGSEADRNRIYAQAKVARAFEYLYLIAIYGKQYDAATAATDYGVPLVLSEEVGMPTYKRNSVAEVYAQIKEDLESVVNFLPDVVSYAFYANKLSAYSLLARMYLYMGDYENALANANKCLGEDNRLEMLDYRKYKKIDGTQWRNVVTDDENEEEMPYGQYGYPNREHLFLRFISGHQFNAVAESDDLKQAFAKRLRAANEEVDLREDLFFRKDKVNRGSGFEYFEGYSNWFAFINLNCGTALPEMKLIAAECEARVGSTANAVKLINDLREYRVRNFTDFNAADFTDRAKALELVLDERRCEYAMQGYMRYVDLKRLGTDPATAKTVTHTVGSDTWTLPANDPRYIMPIPQDVLEYDPNIPQYER